MENSVSENDSAKSNENTKTDIIDDLLDDSLTEAMVLCSQAVEQSLPVPNVQVLDSSATNADKKHFSTPPENWKMKRRKIDEQSTSDDPIDVSPVASVCENSKARTKEINVSTKNEVDTSRKSGNKLNFSCKSKSTTVVTEVESIKRLTEKTEASTLSGEITKNFQTAR